MHKIWKNAILMQKYKALELFVAFKTCCGFLGEI